ncbi:MAG: hypothetical protein Q9220_001167 [cf. Caloplaca sp. 1 TL-2023]
MARTYMAPTDPPTKNPVRNVSTTGLSDEFTGLLLRPNREGGVNVFTAASLGLFAIAALKEEALKNYSDPVFNYDFMDGQHPGEPPLGISIRVGSTALLESQVKRSTIMWAINMLALEMMQTRYLHRLPFTVNYFLKRLYIGLIGLDSSPTSIAKAVPASNNSLSAQALRGPLSLAVNSTSSTSMQLLNSSSPLQDHPRYDLTFRFSPPPSSRLREYETLKSLMATLLQLAKHDAASIQERIELSAPRFGVWVFMKEEALPPSVIPDIDFQQYHAVAIIEAMARYFQAQAQYREMTFKFTADGELVATGCVTRDVLPRRWCTGMSWPDGPVGQESMGQEVATS